MELPLLKQNNPFPLGTHPLLIQRVHQTWEIEFSKIEKGMVNERQFHHPFEHVMVGLLHSWRSINYSHDPLQVRLHYTLRAFLPDFAMENSV